MAQITVDVGVKLNVMQSSLADLQKILNHLEPDSSGFKNLSKVIAEMTREMERFQVQTSKGFSSSKQFDQAERSIEKMEETLAKAQLALNNLKFSDIKLDANQIKAFSDLEQAVVVAEQRLDSLKEKTKKGIFSDAAAINTLKVLDPKGITKNFDEIDAIVTRGTKEIEGKIINAKAQLEELQALVNSQQSNTSRATALLAKGITADDWGNLLNTAGTGFKSGGKQEFLKILKDQFQVSEADINEIKKLSFDKINQAFKEHKFDNIFDNFNKSFNKNKIDLSGVKTQVKEYEELQKAIEALYSKINAAKADGSELGQGMSVYNAEIERVAQALAKLRGESVQNVSANSNYINSLSVMQGQLQSFIGQLDQASAAFLRLQAQQQAFNSIKMAITNFMGFNQILNLTKTAVRDAMNHIKELDSVMNGISIVTDMTTADLWKQVDAYSAIAQKYGVTIKGAYEVSKIYYQQGLETNDVLTMTNATLELSKVSGLDYAKSTDYMTTAVRGFKMEMQDASSVVDVYSNLAANTAVSQEELAVAMSKTASSMESVGSTFEETSAMIATMVAVTRESATNIGSAMKSIASRYGELTKDPSKLIDAEGEVMAFNKVDQALQSIGISMKTVDGQFREFTDVILELSDVWDQLSSVQQRYVATQFAGNRQQSRFLALVSNGELLRENIETAEDSEDVGTLQALKALDSLESKLNQVQVAYQQFYTTIGAENVWKGALDGIKNFINSLNNLPKVFGVIPLNAIAILANGISLIKSLLLNGLSQIGSSLKTAISQSTLNATNTALKEGSNIGRLWGQKVVEEIRASKAKIANEMKNAVDNNTSLDQIQKAFGRVQEMEKAAQNKGPAAVAQTKNYIEQQYIEVANSMYQAGQMSDILYTKIQSGELTAKQAIQSTIDSLRQQGEVVTENSNKVGNLSAIWETLGNKNSSLSQGLTSISQAFTLIGMTINKSTEAGRRFGGTITALGGGLQTLTASARLFAGDLTAIPQVAMGILNVINGFSTAWENPQEKLERLTKEAEELSNTAKQVKADEKTLQTGIDKVNELKEKRYESAEAAEEYQKAAEDLAETFPQLIVGFDEAGNVIVATANAENMLAAARQKTLQATYDAAVAEQKVKQQEVENARNNIKSLNNRFLSSPETFGSDGGQREYIAGLLGQLGIYGDNNSLVRGLYDQSISTNEIITSDNLQSILSTLSQITGVAFDKTVENLEDLRNVLEHSSIYDNNAEQIEDLLTGLEEIASTGLKNDYDILTDFAAELDNIDLTSKEGQERYAEFIAAYNRLDEETQNDFNERILNVQELIDSYSVVSEGAAQLQGMDKGVISSWLQLTKAQEDGWKFINNNSQAVLLLTKQMYDAWDGKGSWDQFKTSEIANSTLTNFKEGYDQLEDAQKKLLEDIGNDTSSYTAQDIIQMLNDAGKEINDSMRTAVEGYYSNGQQEMERINNIFKGFKEENKPLSKPLQSLQDKIGFIDISSDFSSEAADFIAVQTKEINRLSSMGFEKAAEELSEQTSTILNKLYNIQTKAQDRNAILDILNQSNLNTVEGIEEAISLIESSGADQSVIKSTVDELEARKQRIVDNVALSIQSELDSLLEKAEDDTKILSKATSGMTMKEANELVNKAKGWGVDLDIGSDIISNGDKLILSEQAFNEIQQKYGEHINEAAEKVQENLKKAQSAGLLDSSNQVLIPDVDAELSQEMREFLSANGFNYDETTKEYLDSNGQVLINKANQLTEAGRETIELLFKNIFNDLETYGMAVEQIQAMIFQQENWNKGDYSSLMKNGAFSSNLDDRGYQSSITSFDVNAFNQYLSGNMQYNAIEQPELKAAVEQARSGVDGFLSGLLSKGIENFNITDYANTGIESSTFNEMSVAIEDWQGSYEDFIRSYVDLTGKTASEIDSLIAQARAKDYENNIYNSLSDIVNSFDKFSYEAGQQLARSLGTSVEDLISKDIFSVDEITGELSATYQQMKAYLITNMHNMSNKQYNELRAKLEAANAKQIDTNIFNDIISNRDKLNEDNLASLATVLNMTYTEVTKILTQNTDGSYKLDLSIIESIIQNGLITVNEETKQLIANEIDSIISSLTGLGQLQGKGTTKIEDMQKRVGDINQQLGTNFNMQDLFVYNENLNAFTYSTQGLQLQAASLAKELDSLKQNTDENADQIWAVEQSMRNIAIEMANNIDVSGFLGMAIGDPARDLKIDELRVAINDYNTVLAKIGVKEGLNTEVLINNLRYGGENAVQAAEAIAVAQGKTLSASDVEGAYRNQVSNFVNAIDTIIAKPGEIVDTITASIINSSGGKAEELGSTGQYVVQSAANLYEAYKNLLSALLMTGEATLADLNKVAALALENRDGEQAAIDALGDAAGMTFTRFGEILADAGIRLTEQMIDDLEASGIINLMGGNKMRIADFSRFADLMGWDANSEEYVSAFKSYNDSLIEMNRKAENNILEEVNALGDAKGGDWLNLTQLSAKLEEAVKYGSYTQLDALTTRLHTLGAELEDGILKLDSDANISGILTTIASYAQQYGGLLQQDMAKLADVLDDVLSSYADAIGKGIKGTLTNTEALDLQKMTEGLGIDMQLDFTQTAEGLKISQEAAIGLYQELQKIDSIKADLVFDDIFDSMTKAGNGFENISQTTAKVEQIQRQLAQNYAEIRNESVKVLGPDTERVSALQKQNAELEAQLSLYEQIQVRQADDPNSYKFMDQSLPSYMQGAENYWNSIGKAFESMNEAGQSGYMSIQDFRNIINEMNNMAAMSGAELEFMGHTLDGSAESASQLIQQGMSHLENIDGKGVKINMNNFGLDISSGAEGMQKGFEEGIKTMAQSQIDMLDAAIQMLEVIVAMEKLGDIDVDENGIFSIGDLFQLDENGNFEKDKEGLTKYTEAYKQYAKDILELAKTNPDLEKGLKNISINGITMKELFEDATDGIKNLNISEQDYFAVMDAFVQAAKNGDYDLEHLQESVWEILDKTLPDGTVIDTGNRSIVISGGTHYSIDWQSENVQDALELFTGKEEKKKQQLKDAFVHYQQGEGSEIEVKSVLVAKGLIEVDPETGDIIVDGKPYKSNTATAQKAIAEASLKNAGFDPKKGTVTEKQGTQSYISIETEVQIGNKTVMVFTDEAGNIKYHSDKLNQDFNSQDDLLHAEHEYWNENFVKTGNEDLQLTYEQFVYQHYGITLKTETTITDANGNTVDPSTNPEVQKQLEELVNMSPEQIQEKFNTITNGDGTITVPLEGGFKFTFAGGEGDIHDQALEALGIDSKLVTSIADGIRTAFTEGDSKTQISEALAEGIRTALSSTSSVEVTGSETVPEVALPEVTIKPEKINFNTEAIASAATSEEVNISTEIPIDSVTVKPNILDLDASGAQQPTGEDVTVPTIPLENVKVTANNVEITSVTNGSYTGTTPSITEPLAQVDAIATLLALSSITGAKLPADYTPNAEDLTIAQASAIVTSLLLDPSSAIVLKALLSGLPNDQKMLVLSALTNVLSMYLDSSKAGVTNTTASMPTGKTLSIEQATALISLINPDTANATLGEITYKFTDTEKTFTAADVFTALIQTITAKTSDGSDGTTKTNVGLDSTAKSVTLPDGETLTIAEALAIISHATAQLGEGVTPITEGVLPGGIEIHRDAKLIIDNITTSGTSSNVSFANLADTAEAMDDIGADTPQKVESFATALSSMSSATSSFSAGNTGVETLNNYIAAIENLVTTGGEVTSLDLSNLEQIKNLGNIEGLKVDALNDVISTIEKLQSTTTELKDIELADSGIIELQALDFSSTLSDIESIKTTTTEIGQQNFTNFITLNALLAAALIIANNIWDTVQKFANQTFTVTFNQPSEANTTVNTTENKTVNETRNVSENTTVSVDTSGAQQSAGALGNAASTMGGQASAAAGNIAALQGAITALSSAVLLVKAQINVFKSGISGLSGATIGATTKINTLKSAISDIPDRGGYVSKLAEAMQDIPTNAGSSISKVVDALKDIPTGSKSLGVTLKYSTQKSGATGNIGNFAHAKGKGQAYASGTRTLMGELGPELVVSNGRYFIVGENGAEFVNLAKDAIVFNHRQTRRLLEQGAIGSRGRPFTNETNAISLAKGRIPLIGPAKDDVQGTETETKLKEVIETISSVSVSPSQSEEIKLFSMAKGSAEGPALASAAAALSALKELRAMWQSLLTASARDLGSQAGRNGGKGGGGGKKPKKGGGGGGGGGSDDEEVIPVIELGTVTEEIQRWYDLLRQIDKIEQDITYQQALRKKYESDRIANGEKIYATYQKELGLLRSQIEDQRELVALQKSWYDAKREELAATSYSKIFTYDENGLQQYTGTGKPGSKLGLDILETLTRRNAKGKYQMTVGEQLNYLKKVGFDWDELRYNDDGTVLTKLTGIKSNSKDDAAIKKALIKEGKKSDDIKKSDIEEKRADILTQMMENFWSRIDGWRDELDSLYDSYNETATNIQDNLAKQNEILQKIVDNEISIEEDIYKAIEAREQAEIDRLKEQKEALNDASEDFINGLSDQLNKEKEMYNKDKSTQDLTKLQRQLSILQRSGGSASQIRALQEQIDSKMQEDYFSNQEDQINAMKEASDKQLERLDKQIQLLENNLTYQKEHGLLWKEVREIMKLDSNTILSKIQNWNPEFMEKSLLQQQEDFRDIKERLGIYTEDRTSKQIKEEGFSKLNFESDDNKNLLTSITDVDAQEAAKAKAQTAAKNAYINAIDTKAGEEEAQKAAQKAYTNSLISSKNNYEADEVERTKNAILAAENETLSDEEIAKKDKTIAEQKLENYEKNELAYGKLSDKTSWFSGLTENQREMFETEYYNAIKEQYEDPNRAQIDYDAAIKTAENKIETQAKTEKDNGFKLTANAATYLYDKKLKKWVKQKPVLSKNTTFKILKTKDGYVQIQALGVNNAKKYWVKKSLIPSDELIAHSTTADTSTALTGATEVTNEADNYKKLVAEGLLIKKDIKKGIKLGKNIKYNSVSDSGVKTTPAITNSSGTTTKKITSMHIKTINGLKSNGAFSSVVLDKINGHTLTKTYKMSYDVAKKAGIATVIAEAIKNAITGNPKKAISYKFATGGMADFTGPAWLDGTKKKPEAVLNASQTKFLKEDLLGHSPNSLLSIVSALQEAMNDTYSSSIDNSNSMVIENIALNIGVGTISNDYDARRAGDVMMQEIMKVARKTGTNFIIRR